MALSERNLHSRRYVQFRCWCKWYMFSPKLIECWSLKKPSVWVTIGKSSQLLYAELPNGSAFALPTTGIRTLTHHKATHEPHSHRIINVVGAWTMQICVYSQRKSTFMINDRKKAIPRELIVTATATRYQTWQRAAARQHHFCCWPEVNGCFCYHCDWPQTVEGCKQK